MKTLKQSLLILAVATTLFACKKDKDKVDELAKQEILQKKIAEIIPKEYQDSLVKLGIVINQDVNPPKLDGAFVLKILKLIKSNVPGDVQNMSFADVEIKFFDQNSDNSIKTVSRTNSSNGSTADTSIVTAISGSGKQFTVYGKTKAVKGSNQAIFGRIYSGEIDGGVIKNVRYGLINIDNSKGGGAFIKQGQGRVIRDEDGVSEQIPMF